MRCTAITLGIFCLGLAPSALSEQKLLTPSTLNNQHSLGLNQFNLSPSETSQNPTTWLKSFFPKNPPVELVSISTVKSNNGVLVRSRVNIQGKRVLNVSLSTLTSKDRLIWLNAETPTPPIDLIEPWPQFKSPEEQASSLFQFSECQCTFEKVFYPVSNVLKPAWRIVQKTAHSKNEVIVMDALSGEVFRRFFTGFSLHQANVFGLEKPRKIQKTKLQALDDSGNLKSKNHSVKIGPSYEAVTGDSQSNFLFTENTDEAVSFEQVQAYHSTSIVQKWFEKLPYKSDRHLTVSLYDERLQQNNAAYLPESAEIIIAGGDGSKAASLGSDVDIIAHEYGHHVIYQFINAQKGESGALHEGIADYFTYAMTSGTQLAAKAFLGQAIRSAKIDKSRRIDLPDLGSSPHANGEILAAALWEIRQGMGKIFDDTVYRSLNLVSSKAGYHELILALLAIDLDANPDVEAASDKGVYGANKCLIMSAFVSRGFATFFEAQDGESCDLDLEELAAQSRLIKNPPAPDRSGVNTPSQFLGRPCGVFPNSAGTNSLPLTLLIIAPLFMCLLKRRIIG